MNSKCVIQASVRKELKFASTNFYKKYAANAFKQELKGAKPFLQYFPIQNLSIIS